MAKSHQLRVIAVAVDAETIISNTNPIKVRVSPEFLQIRDVRKSADGLDFFDYRIHALQKCLILDLAHIPRKVGAEARFHFLPLRIFIMVLRGTNLLVLRASKIASASPISSIASNRTSRRNSRSSTKTAWSASLTACFSLP